MWVSLKISRKDETVTILKTSVKVDPLSIMLLMQTFTERLMLL